MTLEELRNEIDGIDRQLTELLEARLSAVSQIATVKADTGKAVRDPERERELLAKIADSIKNPDYKEAILATFDDILRHSRDYQNKKLKG